MCSTPEARLARVREAIDAIDLDAQAAATGRADPEDLAARLAGLWDMIAELDPALASRLRSYLP